MIALIGAIALMLGAETDNPKLDVPFFRQQKNGCGAASVAMVMHYWARERPELSKPPPRDQVYRELYDPAGGGIPLAAMKQFLNEHGFAGYTLRGETADLAAHVAKGRPIIVGLKPNDKAPLHFAVVAGVEPRHVWLNDPTASKAARMEIAKFKKQWTRGGRWMLLGAPK